MLIFSLLSVAYVSGDIQPPSVAQEFSSVFESEVTLVNYIFTDYYVYSIKFKLGGNLSVSYSLGAAKMNFTSCIANLSTFEPICDAPNSLFGFEGLLTPDPSHNMESNFYKLDNSSCHYAGNLNKSLLNQYLLYEIPNDAEYLGTKPIRGYSCSGWRYQRYGVVYDDTILNLYENVTQWVDVATGAIVNLTLSYASIANGSVAFFDPFLIVKYRANNIVVGGIPKSAYSPPSQCNSSLDAPKREMQFKEHPIKNILSFFTSLIPAL